MTPTCMLLAEGTLNVVHVLVSTALAGVVQVRNTVAAQECSFVIHCWPSPSS